ncbi:unnamed protein product [marine sediment metagenome]|uniref:Uncharacterized protein n=1 Tax=marine sediment metagenome TaxID=412755 RepID=X1K8C4_9ZZZZ
MERDINIFNSVTIKIASPETIKSWIDNHIFLIVKNPLQSPHAHLKEVSYSGWHGLEEPDM